MRNIRRWVAVLVLSIALPALADRVWNDRASRAQPVLNVDETVAGPDVDANGVRDDIDAFVGALPFHPAKKRALLQMSRAIQTAMTVDVANGSARQAAAAGVAGAASCMHARFDTVQASQKNRDVREMTVNTRQRVQAYEHFNEAMSKYTFELPKGNGCVV